MKKQIKLVIKIMVMIICIFAVFMSVKSKAEDIDTKKITSNYYEIDYEKNIISRIEPETTVEKFKEKIGKYIIYKDKEKTEEVATGLIGTGMYLESEEKDYELSVVGDFDGDGKATQVELTNTIRHIVGLKGAKLEGIRYESADLTGDGQVDQRDITKFIRYIVYGELDLGKQDTTPPTVSIEKIKQTSNEIKLQAIAIDSESGMGESAEYTFYLKKSNEDDKEYKEIQKGTNAILDLTNLEHNTKYSIKVITKDVAGNEGQATINVATNRVPNGNEAGAIEFEETVWENNMASVKIKTDTSYKIQYQVNGTNGNWITGDYITGLRAGDIVYARLTDGTNVGTFIFKTIEPDVIPIPDGNESGAIIFGEVTWENNKASIQISTNTEYMIEYQVNSTSGTWTRGNVVTNLNHNDIIYARLTDGTEHGNYTTLTIIDNIIPNVKLTTSVKSTTEITAEANATDNETGIDTNTTYEFYIKEESEDETKYKLIQETTSKTCSFTQLKAGNEYTIKVEVQDKAGNKATKTATETVDSLPDGVSAGSILFSGLTWTNGTAEVLISTNTEYIIEYQVNGTSGTWIKATEPKADITATGLNHNDIIYARLTDGTSSGSYMTLTVVDLIKPDVDLVLNAENETITATANAKDLESGIGTDVLYKFYMKETGAADSTYVEKQNTTSNILTQSGLTVGKNYTIKVEVQDKAGNKGMIEKSILIPDDIAPIVDFSVIEKTSSSAKVQARATDVGGLPSPTIYIFYIKETGADDSTYVEKQNGTSDTCEFTGLEQKKDYTVKVTVEDEAGNVGVKERSILTDSIPDATEAGAINFESLTWKTGKAEIVISTKTKYTIEYQVNGINGTWTKASTPGTNVTVSNLNHNDIIYARLTDGTSSSNYTTLTVIDSIKPKSFTITVTDITRNGLKITGQTTDNETGIKDYTYVVEKKGVTTSKTKENNEDVGGIISASSNTKTESNNINRVSYNNSNSTNTNRSSNSNNCRRRWINSKCRKSKIKTNESRSKRKHRNGNY